MINCNRNRDYQAKIVNELIHGKKLPTILEIVKKMILSSDIVFKKEEIDESVCRQIGCPIDKSISAATSYALYKLESENSIVHVKHGYWKKC